MSVRGAPKCYWLVVRHERDRMEVLTTKTSAGDAVLPVFGSGEEAEAFLPNMGDWEARETSAGELVSVLSGPCRDAKLVALDPTPEMKAGVEIELVSVGRESFVEPLLGRGRPWFERACGRQ